MDIKRKKGGELNKTNKDQTQHVTTNITKINKSTTQNQNTTQNALHDTTQNKGKLNQTHKQHSYN